MLRKLASTLALTATLAIVAMPAHALERRGEQVNARQQMMSGQQRTLRDLREKAIRRMPGKEYIGFNYFPDEGIYRFRFIDDGRVIYLDMDGRDGRVVGER